MTAGWPTVAEFVARALYDPETGFYETGGRAGRHGASFLTSPEVGPLFGAVVANAIDRWWADAGRPDRWVVVDAGAGPATLAKAILKAQPACAEALELVCVERSAAQRALHPDTVRSVSELPPTADVIIANELLDNLEFDIIERTSAGWAQVRVGPGGETAPDGGGRRVPVAAAAVTWVLDARSRCRHLVCIDYGDDTAALADRPWRDWVRAFAGQERVEDPFLYPGTRDVTVVVPIDQLPTPSRRATQADWLRTHGIDHLVETGRDHWEANAHAPDLAAMTMRSRVNEAAALCASDGLGAFVVLEWLGGGSDER